MLLVAAHAASGAEKFVPSLTARTDFNLSVLGDERDDGSRSDQSGIEGPLAGTITSGGAPLQLDAGSAGASAYAGYGVLGASAIVSVRSAPVSKERPAETNGQARAGASFADELTITRAGPVTGGRGSLRVAWQLSGSWGGGLTGPLPRRLEQASADWNLHITTGTARENAGEQFEVFSEVIASGEFYQDREFTEISSMSSHRVAPGNGGFVVDSQSQTGALPPIWTELSFVFGVPFRLGVSLGIDAQARATNLKIDLDDPAYLQLRTAEAYGQFGHTLRWGGVQQVLDASGQTVSGWTVRSESGIDYAVANTTAVPEPSVWLLMLPGLAMVAWRRVPVI
jgi:hypothetical protein